MFEFFQRKAHVMSSKTRTSYPANLLFFDTETLANKRSPKPNVERHSLWFGWMHYFRLEDGKRTREGRARFNTITQFWELLYKRLDKVRPLYVFAHNLGFDLTIIDFWQTCSIRDWDVEFFVIDDPPTMIGIKIKDSRVYFIDTLNYWR